MAIADLKSVLNIFAGSDIGEEGQGELFKEVLLMTLARAADADINIQTVEVERIQEILKEHTEVPGQCARQNGNCRSHAHYQRFGRRFS